jgi:trimethylamine:corrinoid methyltransferase-like protein
MGRRYVMFQETAISPLRMNDESLSIAMEFIDDDSFDVDLGGSIPMFGVTCPHNLHTALAQSLAERLADDLVGCILTPKYKYGANSGPSMVRVEPFDMQFGPIVFGSPEWTLLNMVVRQLQEYWTGIKCYGGSFRSTSKYPDEQAATERTACVLWQAMQGARSFGAVGQLSVDEVFSPQQAMFDYEILGYVERMTKGLDYDTDVDPIELLKEGMGSENYMTSELTSTKFKDFYYFPEIFKHWNVGNWSSKGSPKILDDAWKKAQKMIKEASFKPTEAQEKEVNRIYKRAEENLLKSK